MKIKTYFREIYKELAHKVTWPTWKELQSSAITVMIASALIAMIIFMMDMVLKNLMEQVYKFIA